MDKKGTDWQQHFHDDELLVAATRYYMPRTTGAAEDHAQRLRKAWPDLPERLRCQLRDDLWRFAASQEMRVRKWWAPMMDDCCG